MYINIAAIKPCMVSQTKVLDKLKNQRSEAKGESKMRK